MTIDVTPLTANGQAMYSNKALPEGQPLIIVRNSATSFTAVSSYCPHQGCEVNLPSGGRMICTCHNSVFDSQGNYISGPAGQSLSKYTTTYDANTKTITVTY